MGTLSGYVAGLVCCFAQVGPAVAQVNRGGPRVEAVGGYDQTDAAPGLGAQDGLLYGVRAGFDHDLGTLMLGVEGDFVLSDASTAAVNFASDAKSYWTLAVRAGLPLGEHVLAFARGGLAHADIDTSLGEANGTGFTAGGGLELGLGSSLFLRGEYRYSDYGARLRGQHYIAGIGWRF